MKKTIGVVAMCLVIGLFLVACQKSTVGQIATEPIAPGVDYDVIVVAAEPEGIAAAVSAARNGMKTLLLEDDLALGGLMTLGQLNFIDVAESRSGELLTRGIYSEFSEAVGGTAFDIAKAKEVFYQMVTTEPNITLVTGVRDWRPVLAEPGEGGMSAIDGIAYNVAGNEVLARASVVIDGTTDADIAAAAGVPYTFGGEDIGEKDRQMGVTLVFTLSGVDWEKVTAHLKNDGNDGTDVVGPAGWGYTREGFAYEPIDPHMRLRGFNIARQENGDVLINALIIFDVDVLDQASKDRAIARGQAELVHIVPYVQANFVGFEEAALVGTAEQLYVRESRHIIGEYQLSIDDVLENRDQWNKIAIGNYPVDVQPTESQRYGTVIGFPDRYAIPLGCLVPLQVDDLLVVGRSASYTSLAAGSARIMPIGMACGQGAGVAAAYAIRGDMRVRDLVNDEKGIAAIQKTLKQQGAYLADINVHEAYMDHWAYPGVKVIRSLGILDGGYDNNYHLEDLMSKWRYQNMINKTLKKTDLVMPYIEVNEDPTNREIILSVARVMGYGGSDYQEALISLNDTGIMTETLVTYFVDENKRPQAGEVIMLVANLYSTITQQ